MSRVGASGGGGGEGELGDFGDGKSMAELLKIAAIAAEKDALKRGLGPKGHAPVDLPTAAAKQRNAPSSNSSSRDNDGGGEEDEESENYERAMAREARDSVPRVGRHRDGEVLRQKRTTLELSEQGGGDSSAAGGGRAGGGRGPVPPPQPKVAVAPYALGAGVARHAPPPPRGVGGRYTEYPPAESSSNSSSGGVEEGDEEDGDRDEAADGGEGEGEGEDGLTSPRGDLDKDLESGEVMTAYFQKIAAEYAQVCTDVERVDVMGVSNLNLGVKLRHGHKGGINVVRLMPDGITIASGGVDGVICIWDLATAAPTKRLKDHTGAVLDLQWSPSSESTHLLLSCGQDGAVKIWDVSKGVCNLTFRDHGVHKCVGALWASDASMLATAGSSCHILVYNMQRVAADLTKARNNSKAMIMVDIKPAAGAQAGSGGSVVGNPDGHSGPITKIVWTQNNNCIISASEDGTARIWDVTVGGRLVCTLRGHRGPVLSLALSPNGKRVLTGGEDGTARIWQFATGECLRTLYHHPDSLPGNPRVLSVAFSTEGGGRRAISGGADGTLAVWETRSGLEMDRLEEVHKGPIYGMEVRLDGLILATASSDSTIGLWAAAPSTFSQNLRWCLFSCCSTCSTDCTACWKAPVSVVGDAFATPAEAVARRKKRRRAEKRAQRKDAAARGLDPPVFDDEDDEDDEDEEGDEEEEEVEGGEGKEKGGAGASAGTGAGKGKGAKVTPAKSGGTGGGGNGMSKTGNAKSHPPPSAMGMGTKEIESIGAPRAKRGSIVAGLDSASGVGTALDAIATVRRTGYATEGGGEGGEEGEENSHGIKRKPRRVPTGLTYGEDAEDAAATATRKGGKGSGPP